VTNSPGGSPRDADDRPTADGRRRVPTFAAETAPLPLCSDEVTLAAYATRSAATRGRRYPIKPDPTRTEFQRDRDRIIHCAAFRKLEYKTQVYVIHEGDYYRTRLTHTLEVSQIARTVARRLGLNQDLTEAIALAHDLGHTPFGHSGETALRKLLADRGGFEHNRQSLRVVETLEERHHEIPGLNLTWEVREGIAKHATYFDAPGPGDYEPDLSPSLEAQVCNLADVIAYNHHDLDDALKMGLVDEVQLEQVGWVGSIWREERAGLPADVRPKFAKYRALGRMMSLAVEDVVRQTLLTIEGEGLDGVARIRARPGPAAAFSPAMEARQSELRDFLYENVYRHPHVVRMQTKAERFVTRLFELYRATPEQLPVKYQRRIAIDGLETVITDYISGMTDSFCMQEYIRAFEPTYYRPI